MPVSSTQPEARVQTLIEVVEEVLQRHPQRCKHLHPRERGRVYQLPMGLLGELCPVCEDEFRSRLPELEPDAEREGHVAGPLLGFSEGAPSLDDYRGMVKRQVCRWCGVALPSVVLHYPHPDGWPVEGLEGLQWLYIRCVKCDYDWALWKLGVPRHEEAGAA